MYTELQEHIELNGYNFTAEKLKLDNEMHSLQEGNFKGWYWGSVNETSKGQKYATLTYLHYQRGVKHFVRTDIGKISKEELSRIETRQRQEQKQKEAEIAQRKEEVAQRSLKEWNEFKTSSKISGYCKRKKIGQFIEEGSLHGAKVLSDGSLIIPMKDIDGKFWGYQTIDAEGQKLYLPNQKVEGCFFRIGPYNPKEVVYICEGFATGVSIYAATGKTTVVAFSAGGLQVIARAFRDDSKSLRIVICGDEDIWNTGRGGRPNHTGRRAAKAAARACQGSICQVSFRDIDADTQQARRPTDFNDLQVLCGLERVAEQIGQHYETRPEEYIPTEHTGFHEEVMTRQGPRNEPKPLDLYRFHERFNYLRSCEGKVYEYRRGVYEEISSHALKSFAQEHYQIGEEKVATRFLRDEFVAHAQTESNVSTEWWDYSTEGFINFKNGLFNKKTEELEPHDPAKGFRFQLTYNYKPQAKAPTWEKMLEKVTVGDEKLANLLEEYVGYCLSNDKIWEHKALMLIGDGSNGKSTFINTVENLLGEENTAAVSVSGLALETRRDMIHGKLAILCEENNIKHFDSDHFKNIVGGGTTDARALYKNPYKFKNRAKMIVAFNNFDRVQDLSHGLFRRLLLAPFNAKFEESSEETDKFIEDKLHQELPAIFNRCWEAYKRMKARGGFEQVKAITNAVEQLKYESDTVLQYAQEASLKPWDKVPVNGEKPPVWAGKKRDGTPYVMPNEVFRDYLRWAEDDKMKFTLSKTMFKKRLLNVLKDMEGGTRIIFSGPITVDKVSQNCWIGVDWRGVSKF